MSRLAAMLEASPRNRALLGVALLVLGVLLLGLTERADRLRVMAEDALGGFVLTGTAATPSPASDGRLVLATGAPEVHAPAHDAQFGVAVAAPALVRKVEMLQWDQVGSDRQPGYELDWFDHPIDSSGFAQAAGHANPGPFPITAARFNSPDVTVAGFKLAQDLVEMIPGVEPFAPDFSQLPPNMAASFQVFDGALVTSANPSHPKVGDLRISWMKIAPSELSVFARDQGGTLVSTHSPDGDAIAQVMIGSHPLIDVLSDAPRPPHFKWARRVLALLLAWAGAALALAWWNRHDKALSLAVGVVPLAIVAAAYWWEVRMPVAIAMVFIALAGIAVCTWRWRLQPTGR